MRGVLTMGNLPQRIGSAVLILIVLVFIGSCGKKVTRDDTRPPVVEIVSPAHNAVVSDTVQIRAEAQDDGKISKVEFYIDSQLLFTDTQSPWIFNWITYLYDDKSYHTIFAVAYDQAGNSAASPEIRVSVQVTPGFYFISDYYTPGMAYDVFLQGEYAYVADGEEGLRVINAKNAVNPYFEANFKTSGFTKGVFVYGDYCYLANGTQGLQIVDISDPSHPDSAGRFDTPGSAEDVFLAGDFVYVADGGEGLQIIDVSDPNNPDTAAQFSAGSVKGVFVTGSYAYLATSTGLQILDVSDPTSPDPAGFVFTLQYQGNAIWVEGSYAYLAALEDGLHIFDVSDPYSPRELDTVYRPGGKAYGVFVKDDLAYIAFGDEGVHVIDVSDPRNLEFVGRFDTEGNSFDLFVSDKFVYVADYFSLVILRLSRSQ